MSNRSSRSNRGSRQEPTARPSRLSRRLAWTILTVVLSGVIASCTGAAPEVVQTRHRVRYVDDRQLEARYEQLELFVLASDVDGFDDLSTLYLVHEEQELWWELDESNWSVVSIGDEQWIGATGFTAPRLGSVPRGRYRVIVEDVAGDRGEADITVTAPAQDLERFSGPTLSVTDNGVRLDSAFRSNRVELRDGRGSLVRSLTVEPGQISTAQLAGGDSARDEQGDVALPRLVDLYAFGRGPEGTLYISGPYRL